MNKTIVAMALIAALAFALVGVSSFVEPVSAAKPGNVPLPPSTGQETANSRVPWLFQ